MSKVKYLHFKLGDDMGRQLTEMARCKAWNDCKEAEAIIMLTDVCIGMTNDQARDVIHGKAKLETNKDGVTFDYTKDTWSPPDLDIMMEEIMSIINEFPYDKEMHRPKHPMGGVWYERLPPHTQAKMRIEAREIKTLSKLHVHLARDRARLFKEWCKSEKSQLEEYDEQIYMEEQKDKALEALDCIIFWEQRSPHGSVSRRGWFDQLEDSKKSELIVKATHIKELLDLTPTEAISKAKMFKEECEALMMEIVKKHKSFDDTDEVVARAEKFVESRKDVGGFIDKMRADLMTKIALSDLPEEEKRGLMMANKGITNAIQHGVPMIRDDDFEFTTGWLSPNGVYYGCEYGQHIFLAEKLAMQYGIDGKFDRNAQDAEGWLEDNGWAKCGDRKWYLCKKMTADQVATFNRWKKKWGEPLEFNEVK